MKHEAIAAQLIAKWGTLSSLAKGKGNQLGRA